VAPETARNYELGWKQSLWNNRAMFSLAAFRTDFRNFQQSAGFFDYDGIFRTALNSIGGLRTEGLELEGSARVTPLLQLNGSLAYTKATIQEFRNGPCYNVLNAAGTAAVPGTGLLPEPGIQQHQRAGPGRQDAAERAQGQTEPGRPARPAAGGAALRRLRLRHDALQSRTQYLAEPGSEHDPGRLRHHQPELRRGREEGTLEGQPVRQQPVRQALCRWPEQFSIANSTWSPKAPNLPLAVNTTEWLPPRDYHRYVGLRGDVTF
jgi:iron complex outermembrane receptor protein